MTPAALASVLADEARRHGLSLVDVAAEVALLATPEEVPEPEGDSYATIGGGHFASTGGWKNCVDVTARNSDEAALVVAVGAAILRREEQ